MKNKIILFISIIGTLLIVLSGTETAFPQGEILSVNPPSAFRGETVHIIIQGTETGFIEGETEVFFPGFIEVQSVLVNNPELLTVRIKIEDDAPAGDCQFDIITGTQKFHVTDKFEITALAGVPEAMITVFPVQSIYLSDFDFSNLQNLPLLFTISVFPADYKTLRVYAELKHERYGVVASANKILENLNPGSIFTFDNRMFDNYDKDIASDEIIESALGNGTIPPGMYYYVITIFDGNGNPIENCFPVQSDFYISESVSGIDMVAPGTPLDSDPEVIYTNTPYFQWFGGLAEYNFTLYEVLEGQRSADDITTNLPVFQMNGLTSASYLYPVFAENLEEGKKYAWQITSGIYTSSGTEKINSDVYWFIYQKDDKSGISLDNITISPDDIDLLPGDSVRIKVEGYDTNGENIKVDCELKVIPKGVGMVNNDGWFVAGRKTGTAAVVATCGSKEDYITINIIDKK
ncbi:MAG: hypothetical protein B6D61_07135 [Bacteroidetes bacterium 4484_249]|nr:MAG: hypothetical protein B6D61_07135 [Bacteroidetes bacterium 4484_249]